MSVKSVTVPHKLSLQVCNRRVEFEVDTGAYKSVISVYLYNCLFSHIKLNRATYRLNSVTGHEITGVGEIDVTVKIKNYVIQPSLTVVDAGSEFTPLLGRNWLDEIFPD